jgi:hypothetical protein
MKALNENRKKNFAVLFLMIATFFNPLGFDILFKMILDLTGSYWLTTGIFYLASASFFGLYFWLSGKKPVQYLIKIIKTKLSKREKRNINGKIIETP